MSTGEAAANLIRRWKTKAAVEAEKLKGSYASRERNKLRCSNQHKRNNKTGRVFRENSTGVF